MRSCSSYLQKNIRSLKKVFSNFQVKGLKKPRFDLATLLELHGDGGGKTAEVSTGAAEGGVVVDRPEGK